jgi:HEAT repeat protein
MALGEVGSDSSLVIPALIDALHDPAGGVRYQAVRSLAKVGGSAKSVLVALQGMLNDPLEYVRDAARQALATAR